MESKSVGRKQDAQGGDTCTAGGIEKKGEGRRGGGGGDRGIETSNHVECGVALPVPNKTGGSPADGVNPLIGFASAAFSSSKLSANIKKSVASDVIW